MEHVAVALDRVLTEMPGHSTKEKLPSTPTHTLPEFKTLNDPVLEKMSLQAEQFLYAMESGLKPYWISFCGQSGTGKTFLAKLIRRRVPHGMTFHDSLICGVMWFTWPDVLRSLRGSEYWIEDDIADSNVALLDDIGADRDPTGFAADSLYRVLNRRRDKWTVITSNLTIEKIACIDGRIASRLIRDNNVCVKCDTIDFALRKAT